jgi:hypothetical protein
MPAPLDPPRRSVESPDGKAGEKHMSGSARTRAGLVLLAVGLVGCGGSGNGDEPNVLEVVAASDGLFRSDFSIDASSPTQQIGVGADGANFVHGWIRFIHAPTTIALVADNVVLSVTLEVTKASQSGDPETDHPTVALSHTDYGDLIEGSDYALVGTAVAGGTFAPTGLGAQTFSFDVRAQVIADILAGRTYSDFYLGTSGVQTAASYWIFEDVEPPATGNEPLLVFRLAP